MPQSPQTMNTALCYLTRIETNKCQIFYPLYQFICISISYWSSHYWLVSRRVLHEFPMEFYLLFLPNTLFALSQFEFERFCYLKDIHISMFHLYLFYCLIFFDDSNFLMLIVLNFDSKCHFTSDKKDCAFLCHLCYVIY